MCEERGYEWEGMKGWWYEALIGHGLMNLSLSHSEAIKTKPSSSRSINECPQSNNIISIHKRNFTYYIHFPSLAILQTIITLYRHRLHMTWSLILAKSDFATKPFWMYTMSILVINFSFVCWNFHKANTLRRYLYETSSIFLHLSTFCGI